jgi:peptide subunit release factor 1 (eRF1)
MSASSKAFLSVFLSGPEGLVSLERRFQRMREAVEGDGRDGDELQIFDESARVIREYLQKHPLRAGPLCIYSCWLLDFFESIRLPRPVGDLVWFDSSPYIRPLAELEDEYENVAVVLADNKKARIFVVSSTMASDADVIRGNIKNHVKKGGWSQQRYERRRDKQLLLYARDIVQALVALSGKEDFRRIVLAGGKEILRIVEETLPQTLAERVTQKGLDLGKPEAAIHEDLCELFAEQERQSERDLWEKIRSEYLRGGLGTVGFSGVLRALREGRVEQLIVDRVHRPKGKRCRDCDYLDDTPGEGCAKCGSASTYEVDLVNEIVELSQLSGAGVDFADPIPSLRRAGHVAALLRY